MSRSLVAKRTHEVPLQPPLAGAALMSPDDDGARETTTRRRERQMRRRDAVRLDRGPSARVPSRARGRVRRAVGASWRRRGVESWSN